MCHSVILWLFILSSKTNFANIHVTVIQSSWNDDFLIHSDNSIGWLNDTFLINNQYHGVYYGHSHHNLLRWFECSNVSLVSIEYKFLYCDNSANTNVSIEVLINGISIHHSFSYQYNFTIANDDQGLLPINVCNSIWKEHMISDVKFISHKHEIFNVRFLIHPFHENQAIAISDIKIECRSASNITTTLVPTTSSSSKSKTMLENRNMTHKLECGRQITGNYSGESLVFYVLMTHYGNLIFIATYSSFTVTQIQVYNNQSVLLTTDDDHDGIISLIDISSGTYWFVLYGDVFSPSDIFDVWISCEPTITEALLTSQLYISTVTENQNNKQDVTHLHDMNPLFGSSNIVLLSSLVFICICVCCGLLFLWCYLRSKRQAKQLEQNMDLTQANVKSRITVTALDGSSTENTDSTDEDANDAENVELTEVLNMDQEESNRRLQGSLYDVIVGQLDEERDIEMKEDLQPGSVNIEDKHSRNVTEELWALEPGSPQVDLLESVDETDSDVFTVVQKSPRGIKQHTLRP